MHPRRVVLPERCVVCLQSSVQGPYGNEGHYQGPQIGSRPPGPPPQEIQATQTIRNQVNLKKKSIRVSPMLGNDEQLAVSFRFDATTACRAAVFINAKEDTKKNKIICDRDVLAIASYEKGVGQGPVIGFWSPTKHHPPLA